MHPRGADDAARAVWSVAGAAASVLTVAGGSSREGPR